MVRGRDNRSAVSPSPPVGADRDRPAPSRTPVVRARRRCADGGTDRIRVPVTQSIDDRLCHTVWRSFSIGACAGRSQARLRGARARSADGEGPHHGTARRARGHALDLRVRRRARRAQSRPEHDRAAGARAGCGAGRAAAAGRGWALRTARPRIAGLTGRSASPSGRCGSVRGRRVGRAPGRPPRSLTGATRWTAQRDRRPRAATRSR